MNCSCFAAGSQAADQCKSWGCVHGMTAELPVTQATLDAAVSAGADALCDDTFEFTAVEQQPDGTYGIDLPAEHLALTVLTAALPVLAAAIEQGALSRMAEVLFTEARRMKDETTIIRSRPGMTHALGYEDAAKAVKAAAIARAGTSGGGS